MLCGFLFILYWVTMIRGTTKGALLANVAVLEVYSSLCVSVYLLLVSISCSDRDAGLLFSIQQEGYPITNTDLHV